MIENLPMLRDDVASRVATRHPKADAAVHEPSKFGYIDALPGYAILGVMLVHTSQFCGLGAEFAWGARGVQLFFVASAFTLMSSWQARNDGAMRFYVRRLFRIAPMWWIALIVFAPVLSFKAAAIDVTLNALLLHGLSPTAIEAGVRGGWSVGIEMLFYALFPLLAFAIRGAWQSIVFLVLAYWGSEWWLDHRAAFAPDPFAFFALPSQMTAFAAGICAYWLGRWIERFDTLGSVLIVAGAALATRQVVVNVHDLPVFGLAFGLLILGFAIGGLPMLAAAPIRFLGTVSYSVYLLHWLAIDAIVAGFGKPLNMVIMLPAVLVLSTLLATAAYRTVELPCIAAGKKLMRL